MIVGVTGHRPDKLGGYGATNPLRNRIVDAIKGALVDLGATKGITGMAIGADQYFASACLDLGMPFIAAVPFAGQESRWPPASQQAYRELLAAADEVVYVSSPGYARWKMQARNEWVVDHCTHLVAVWNGSSGGTANTIMYANKVTRPIHIINPRELEDEWQEAVTGR